MFFFVWGGIWHRVYCVRFLFETFVSDSLWDFFEAKGQKYDVFVAICRETQNG